MKKNLIKSLSLSLVVLFFGVLGCEPPADDADKASTEAVVEAEEAGPEAEEAIEVDSLPDEKERMSELLKMEKKAAETTVTAENADEVAAQLEAEIAADLE